MPAAEAGLQHGTVVMLSSERSLPAVAGFSRNKFTRPGRRGDRGGLQLGEKTSRIHDNGGNVIVTQFLCTNRNPHCEQVAARK
jgi:hypothetical protein